MVGAVRRTGGTTMQLFASCSRNDLPAAEQLAADLARAGLPVWLDRALPGGSSWWEDRLRRIRHCDVFLFVLTASSSASRRCRAELSYARALGVPVVAGHPRALGAAPFIPGAA